MSNLIKETKKLLDESVNIHLKNLIKEQISINSLKEEEEEKGSVNQNKNDFKYKFAWNSSFPKKGQEELAKDAIKQLKSGDPNASIYKAMEFKVKDENGNETVQKPDVAKGKKWAESLPEDELINRITTVGDKIPAKGLPKKEMPFLPGPPDAKGTVDDVEDALTPGGEYNVDFKEAINPPAPNTFVDMDDKATEFMKSGHTDGKPQDDKATFKKPASIAASEAIPTQSEIYLAKSLGMAINGVAGGNLGAYVSTKGEILDGHHRWAATMLNDPSKTLGGFAEIDLDAMGGKEKALKYLTAIGNALGNKTKSESVEKSKINMLKEHLNIDRWQKLAGLKK